MGGHETHLAGCITHVKFLNSSRALQFFLDMVLITPQCRGQDNFRAWALFASVYGVFTPYLS